MQDYAQCFTSTAVFNAHWYSQLNGVLNIVRTLFVTFALGFAMIIFNKDAQRLVLRPIERMLRKVKEVSENPLAGSKIHSKMKVPIPPNHTPSTPRNTAIAVQKRAVTCLSSSSGHSN